MHALLPAQSVLIDVEAESKKDLLQSVAQVASGQSGLDSHVIFDVLWEREKLGSTGVGYGIAIPHGRVPGVEKVVGLFARLKSPLAYESLDEKPVDLVFLLMAPENAGADHLQALSAVSRLLRNKALCQNLRTAKDAESIYRFLTETEPDEQAA
ncbi:MAG: PTS IIA-like nitrogen regulatory protein PtsN [Alphaproteobacteria bacterium]|nr:PTS IIA-like nitrogen regulatory protein PtsN [Alphaproteobacteria bacterium]